MMSERPEYNNKVKAFAGLAPFNKLAYIKVPPLAIFGPYAESALRLAQAAGGYEVLPKDFQLMSLVRILCGSVAKRVCTFLGDRFNNIGSRYINLTRIPVYLCHNPAGTSMKNVIHYAQLVRSKRAQKFDYGASKNNEVYGQFVFGLLLDAGDVRLGTAGSTVTALDRHGRNDYAPTLPTRTFDYQLHHLTGTCAYRSAVERHQESAQSAAIYAFHKGPPVTGHGGTVDMRFTNCSFVYILQICRCLPQAIQKVQTS
ncbi:lipase lipl-1-like isoform X2 [Dermacentor albipictus]|uniref:lipase lipl-1-like isoform X2 n=1 Tax=Dermacentor albipictus TaxID=60249 RepID=UPI0038FCC8AB